ncbi:hypothetical protein DL93DRAFT_2099201 [Clavulina sp. PMI_390]|nr:hypothetical protein DL93DRAFT_2099201 [Clavulina sp. PMI_390]
MPNVRKLIPSSAGWKQSSAFGGRFLGRIISSSTREHDIKIHKLNSNAGSKRGRAKVSSMLRVQLGNVPGRKAAKVEEARDLFIPQTKWTRLLRSLPPLITQMCELLIPFDNEYDAISRIRRIEIAPPRSIANFCLRVMAVERFGVSDVEAIYNDDFAAPLPQNTPLCISVGDVRTTPEEPIAFIIRDSARREPKQSQTTTDKVLLDPTNQTRVPADIAADPGPGWDLGRTTRRTRLYRWDGGGSAQMVSRLPVINVNEDIWVRFDISRDLLWCSAHDVREVLNSIKSSTSPPVVWECVDLRNSRIVIYVEQLTVFFQNQHSFRFGYCFDLSGCDHATHRQQGSQDELLCTLSDEVGEFSLFGSTRQKHATSTDPVILLNKDMGLSLTLSTADELLHALNYIDSRNTTISSDYAPCIIYGFPGLRG